MNDPILCYCEDVTYDAFRAAAEKHPEADWMAVARILAMGDKCTACLLNAEYCHAEFRQGGYGGKAGAVGGRRLSLKRRLYDLVDRLSPIIRMPAPETYVPLLFGSKVFTRVGLSNAAPERLGEPATDATATLVAYDQDGREIGRETVEVPAGARVEREFRRPVEEGAWAGGHCALRIEIKRYGIRGSLRPHFQIVAEGGVSMLHAQASTRRKIGFVTARTDARERQLLHLTNPDPQALVVNLRVHPLADPKAETLREVALAGRATTVIELPLGAHPTDERGRPGLHAVAGSAPKRFRAHLAIVRADKSQISMDHM